MFSCGVSFADDPKQTLGPGFLDELAEVGYEWLELGPYSYLPTGPEPAVRRAGQAGCVKATCQPVYASLQQADQFDHSSVNAACAIERRDSPCRRRL